MIGALQVLSSLQEAKLNVICYPVCPDVLALCDTLAQIHGETASAAPLDMGQEAQIPLMPFATSFQMLTMHITAMGCGKHLRRGYIMYVAIPTPCLSLCFICLKSEGPWCVLFQMYIVSTCKADIVEKRSIASYAFDCSNCS